MECENLLFLTINLLHLANGAVYFIYYEDRTQSTQYRPKQ